MQHMPLALHYVSQPQQRGCQITVARKKHPGAKQTPLQVCGQVTDRQVDWMAWRERTGCGRVSLNIAGCCCYRCVLGSFPCPASQARQQQALSSVIAQENVHLQQSHLCHIEAIICSQDRCCRRSIYPSSAVFRSSSRLTGARLSHV